jgi:GcrA cell cycle regulator
MEWTHETILRLRSLWDEGHSTAEIGRRLGVSKNAVVGKAHRLDLPARPTPIRRIADGYTLRPKTDRRPAPSVGRSTLPKLASLQQPVPRAPKVVVAHAKPMLPLPMRRLVSAPPPQPKRYGRVVSCCWPIGEPGTSSFYFCSSNSEPGKPYCADHCHLGYVRVRDRREDAIA